MLNEGKRFRHLDLGIFLTPDPLEYVDGFNPYIYVNQNPWGKWDPLGLAMPMEERWKAAKIVGETVAPLTRAITAVENKTINSPRVMGTIQVAGGAAQVTAGAMVSTSGLGATVGVPNVALGVDNIATRVKQVWTGEWQKSYFSQGLEAMGASSEVAQIADISANLIAGTALSTKLLTSEAKVAAESLNKTNSDGPSVFRYVSEGEAKCAQETGFIPNTLSDNLTSKSVFVTPQKIESVVEAETKLKIGKQDPRGIQSSPSHRIEGDATGIKFDSAGKVQGGNAVELTTREKIPVKKIEKLKD